MAEITWTLRSFDLADLTDYFKNPRNLTKAQFEQLKTSLDKFGMIDKPIINLDAAHTVIGGHQRLHVLRAEGVKSVECWIPSRELEAREVEELNIRLNANTGTWDVDVLANQFEMADLKDWGLELPGFDFEEPPKGDDPGAQIDKAEELRVKWGVELGQLWKLGEHRLICGDCTDRAVIERVMGGEKAGAIVTDPPYGIGDLMHGGTWAKKADIEFSKMRTWDKDTSQSFFDMVLAFGLPSIVWGGNYFITPPSRCWLVWDKPEFPTMSSAELAWTNLDHNTKRFEYARTYQAEGEKNHPTQKPIELMIWCLSFLENAAVIIDPFLGGGTTLIACERLHRKCRAVEISPAYVAVALQRFYDMTGVMPELITKVTL